MGDQFIGLGGSHCSRNDILRATSATNNLEDVGGAHTPGAAINAIINGRDKNIKWGCSAEHIRGPVPKKKGKK